MKILITGGGGFVGSRLASALLARGQLDGKAIDRLVLADQVAPRPELTRDPRVESRVGALAGQCEALGKEGFDGVFHLASAVSGECEADFDLGLRSNIDTTRALLDALRAATGRGKAPAKLVFSSSLAVFGPDPSVPLPPLVGDDTLATPKTSYGTHKLICEQLVADYSRKGYIDGRSARLMTVTVRPGRPNGAASSFFSGIVREPLAGVESICPVSPDVSHAVTSVARTVEGLIAVYEASVEQLGGRLGAQPAGGQRDRRRDARRARGSRRSRSARARPLRSRRDDRQHRRQLAQGRDRRARGAPRPAARHELRRHHPPVHRRLPRRPGRSAIAQGPRQGTLMNRIDLEGRVAVVTGGAQGIGYAIAERMLASGASVSLWDADAGQARRSEGHAGQRRPRLRRGARPDERGRRRGGSGADDRRGRQDRHRRQQRRHHRRQRHDLGARARGLAPRHRGEPGRALPRLPRDRAAPDREEVRPDRQHRVGRRQGRQPERLALQRVARRA